MAVLWPNGLRRYAVAIGWITVVAMLACAVLLLLAVAEGEVHRFTVPWFPAVGIEFALRMDSFTAWFGALILALGGCIFLYALSYFSKHPRLPFITACLAAFTIAMLGLIWSDNFYLLFLFWEATSVLSFLLVGFHDDKEDVREKASQALLVTLTGGAAMLVGFVLLQLQFDTSSLSEIVAMVADPNHAIPKTSAMLLIVAGALSKSAQWPFHFWLPNAMAGPTPVSAFLHSATMVKAGVYLLAVLSPLLSTNAAWTPILVTSGMLTVVTAVLRASREDDLKAVLASTTLAALGFLTVLAGVASPAALLGFVIFLTAHALYKAPLFLAAGSLEKQFGTRSLHQLGGAIPAAPWTGAALVLAAVSLIGVAPLPGFLGKEYLLKAVWAYSPSLAFAVAFAAAGVMGLGLKLTIPLLDRRVKPTVNAPLPSPMMVAALLPALGALLLVGVLPLSNHRFLGPAATALGAEPDASYKMWHGWTPALGLGMLALLLSVLIWRMIRRPDFTPHPIVFQPVFETAYRNIIGALYESAAAAGRMLSGGKLQVQLGIILAFVGLLTFKSLNGMYWNALGIAGVEWTSLLLLPLLVVAAIMVAVVDRPLSLLVALGFVGLIVALVFLWFSAPDLALTQLLAETLLLLLLAGVLFKEKGDERAKKLSLSRAGIAIGGGLLTTVLILKAMALEWNHPISEFHLNQSKSAAYGANVVNVILVDFRALDTFGEIVVLAIAALGATAALGAPRKRSPLPANSSTTWLQTGAQLVAAILLPAAIWMFWRGHNNPGGGFIGALFAASAISLFVLTGNPRLHAGWLRKKARWLTILGLSVAGGAALLPFLGGHGFFTGLWWHLDDLHLGTPLLFDLGVFLTVLGFALGFLRYFQPNKT
ncbi:MAG: hydrogen gas-evolving membrane-bound hydrogenase subunit E [Verrucomicrobiota bacterium]